MIAAATGAMPNALPASAAMQPNGGGADAASGANNKSDACGDGAKAANGTSPRASARERIAADRAGRRDDGVIHEDTHDHGRRPREFAELLAEGTPVEQAHARTPASAPDPAQPAAPTSLPDQLLALLAGDLAAPVAAATPASPPAATVSVDGAKAAAAPLAGLVQAAADSAADRSAAAVAALVAHTDAAKPGEDVFAALKLLAGETAASDGDGAGIASDSNSIAGVLPATGNAPSQARAAVAVPGTPLTLPPDPDAGFDDGFGARIAWMAEQRLGHAEIRLNPEHLGPIDVRVQLDGSRVDAQFHSAHAEVRQALEASVPRLRELLGQQGLQLGHADVGQRHAAQQQAAPGAAARAGDAQADSAAVAPEAVRVRSRRLLDEYA